MGNLLYKVSYRIGSRPEGGMHQPHSRHYLVGQYRVDATGTVSPFDFYTSISEPLGLTREAARTLESVPIGSRPILRQEVAQNPFLVNALIYLLSGIGISVEADEDKFFRLADRLWYALPPSVQHLFSAGWNVGASLAAAMMVSYSTPPLPQRPLYRASKEKWSIEGAFTDSDLLPGRMYVFGKFGACDLPEHVDLAIDSPGVLPKLPGLGDRATRSAVRMEGLLQRDHYLRERIAEWLERGAAFDISADDLATIITTLVGGPDRGSFLDWAAAASDHSSHDAVKRRRLIYAIISADPKANLPVRSAAAASTINWLEKVLTRESPGALQAFCDAIDADTVPNEEAAAPWEQLLEASFDDVEDIRAHERLINSRRRSSYGRWVSKNATKLAIAIAGKPTLEALTHDYQLEAVASSAIRRLLAGEPPTEEDHLFVSGLSEEQRARMGRLIERLWKERKHGILEWARLCRIPFEDAFLSIAAGGQVGCDELVKCVRQAQLLGLDSWFLACLAGEALRNVECLRAAIESEPTTWWQVLDLWPPEVRMTVLEEEPEPLPAETYRIEWVPTREDLQSRIAFWFSGREQFATIRHRAKAILQAAARIDVEPTGALSALDICRAFARDEFITGTLLDADEAILAARVLKAAGRFLSSSVAKEAWARVDQGWQVRLLLDTSGFANDLEPTTAHLTLLIAHRRWLRKRLSPHIPEEIRRRFAVLNFEFHDADWKINCNSWYDNYATSPLWAAFHGLPRNCRGPLEPALRAYADDSAAHCCLLHLDLYGDNTAFEDVLKAFVIPHAREALRGGAEELMDIFMAMARGVGNREAQGKLTFAGLRRQSEIELEPDGKLGGTVLQWDDSLHKLRVSASAFPLIWKVLRNPLLPSTLIKLREGGGFA